MYTEVCNIKVNTNVVKCMGIFMSHNKIECYRKNGIDKSEELEKLFETWKKRKLTLFGKCEIINYTGFI